MAKSKKAVDPNPSTVYVIGGDTASSTDESYMVDSGSEIQSGYKPTGEDLSQYAMVIAVCLESNLASLESKSARAAVYCREAIAALSSLHKALETVKTKC